MANILILFMCMNIFLSLTCQKSIVSVDKVLYFINTVIINKYLEKH